MAGARVQRPRRLAAILAAAVALTAGCGGSGAAGSGASGDAGLEGETIRFVVSFGQGGGYDLVARAIAPYLEEELDATVVVENEDGAGGLLAANQVYAAKPDGLTIGFFSGQGIAGATLGGAEGVQFEPAKYSFVGRLGAEPRVLSVGADSGYQTIEDVRAADGLRFASSGPGGSEHIDATVLFPVLGIDGEIITGYEGSAETELAVSSGDTDATSGTVSSRLPPIESGDHRPVLVIGEERAEEFPDVPALLELDLDEQSKTLAEMHTAMQKMGRMVWAPPGVPEEQLATLEEAFRAAAENPDFLAEMEQAQQVVEFTPGNEARSVAEEVLDAPEEYRSLLEDAYEGQ